MAAALCKRICEQSSGEGEILAFSWAKMLYNPAENNALQSVIFKLKSQRNENARRDGV